MCLSLTQQSWPTNLFISWKREADAVCVLRLSERLLGKYLLNVRLSFSVIPWCFVCKRKNWKQWNWKTLGSQLNKQGQIRNGMWPCHWASWDNTRRCSHSLECGPTSQRASKARGREGGPLYVMVKKPSRHTLWTSAVMNHTDLRCPDSMQWDGSPLKTAILVISREKRQTNPNEPAFHDAWARPSKLSRLRIRRRGSSLAWTPSGIPDVVWEKEKISCWRTDKILRKLLVSWMIIY